MDKLRDILACVVLLHPKSRGTVKLQSKDPLNFPDIDTNYLSDAENYDIETIYKGVQYLLKLNNTEALRNYQARIEYPAVPQCDKMYDRFSKKWWYCSIRSHTTTVRNEYHIKYSKLKIFIFGNYFFA